jgi:hypothetical protein
VDALPVHTCQSQKEAEDRLHPTAYSDLWDCVASSVDSITKALPELYQSGGYARIELTKQLDRLVDIMERAAHPMIKIDGQNDQSPDAGAK